MATYDNLPVYKASYDLLIQVFKMVREFSKEYKYTLWDSIKKELIALISNIYKANSKTEKLSNITSARESLEVLKLYFRLCKDLQIINIKTYAQLSLVTEDISKQLAWWQKSIKF